MTSSARVEELRQISSGPPQYDENIFLVSVIWEIYYELAVILKLLGGAEPSKCLCRHASNASLKFKNLIKLGKSLVFKCCGNLDTQPTTFCVRNWMKF